MSEPDLGGAIAIASFFLFLIVFMILAYRSHQKEEDRRYEEYMQPKRREAELQRFFKNVERKHGQ